MRRNILLIIVLWCSLVGFSQNMKITFNDGNTVEYDMGSISSIVFGDGESEGDASIVGTWECTYFDLQTDNPEMFKNTIEIGETVTFSSDGTYYRDETDKGSWSVDGSSLTITIVIPFTYQIKKLTSTELELYADMGFAITQIKFKRVS